MLCDPAPGRGSEGQLVGQQGRGYRSVLISIGDFHAQWRSTAASAAPVKTILFLRKKYVEAC